MRKSLVAAFATFGLAGSVQAGVTLITSEAVFAASGTIVQNTNWDDYGTGWTYPGNNFVVGDLTFVHGARNAIGGMTGYNVERPLLTDDIILGTTIKISGTYDLFGLNAGNFYGAGPALFEVTTNMGTYAFETFISAAPNWGALTFVGFQADAGEYITSVRVSGARATGFTDIQLGNRLAAAVPEPASWAMLIVGFGLVGAAARRRTMADRALPTRS